MYRASAACARRSPCASRSSARTTRQGQEARPPGSLELGWAAALPQAPGPLEPEAPGRAPRLRVLLAQELSQESLLSQALLAPALRAQALLAQALLAHALLAQP